MLGRYSAAQRPLAAAAREPERSQLLPGLVPDPGYRTDVAELRPGDALVCVTDGVIERTDGVRQFDDDVAVLVLAAPPRDAYFRSISSASMTTPSPLAVSTALRIR
jgi:serine phosphatase RsbU (regulator of sigma subunit)